MSTMSQKEKTAEPKVERSTIKDTINPRTPGWASLPSTSAFRAINFELYARPNKFVMVVGATLFLSCMGYIGYMNFTDDKKKPTYVTLDEDGGMTARPKVSKWE